MGKCIFNGWGPRGSAVMTFYLYVNVPVMRSWCCLFSQPLLITSPWVILRVGWSIDLRFPLWWPSPISCREYVGWVKTHYFLFTSTFQCFSVFPILLSHQRQSALSAACWDYSLIIIIIMYVCVSHDTKPRTLHPTNAIHDGTGSYFLPQ